MDLQLPGTSFMFMFIFPTCWVSVGKDLKHAQLLGVEGHWLQELRGILVQFTCYTKCKMHQM